MPWNRVSQFEDAYDAAGIVEGSTPPFALIDSATNAGLIVASDLPRAIDSAERLAGGRRIVYSALLREIRLEPPRWIPFRLPIEAWDAFSHAHWSYRLLVGTSHEFVRRADAAAEWLEQQARAAKSIVAVTHGGFRRILARSLVRRGWRAGALARQGRHANWSSWELGRHD